MSCNIISKCGKDSLMIQNPFNVPINELGDTGLIILLFVLGIYIYIYIYIMIQNPFNVPINELGDTGLIILLFVLGIYIYIYKKNSCIIIIVSGFSY